MKKNILFLLPLLVLTSCGDATNDNTKYYSITINTSENGVVTSEKTSVKEGDFVIFYLEANDKYRAESITINETEYDLVDNNHYTYTNVQSDLVVEGEFVLAPILIEYYNNDDEVIFSRQIAPGEDGSFFGKEPVKKPVGLKTYLFDGWSKTKGGEKVTSFIFNESTKLYPLYNEVSYLFNMNEKLELRTLQTAKLDIETTYPSSYLVDGLMSTNVEVATVDKEGNVEAIGSGTCSINFVVGGEVVSSCEVTVNNIDNVYTEKCYADGEVIYNANRSVGKFKACQTLCKDSSGSIIDRKYVDFSGDFIFGAEITSENNFGLQVCKEIWSDTGAVKKAYQFGCTTGSSSNIFLKNNGSPVKTASFAIEKDVLYNFRVVTSASQTAGKVDVKCYINNILVISYSALDNSPTTNYVGLRYANPPTSSNYITFSNLYVA